MQLLSLLLLHAAAASTVAGAVDVQLVLSGTVPASQRPVALRTATILARQIEQRCNATVAPPPPTARRPESRSQDAALVKIELALDQSLGTEAYAIRDGTNGSSSVAIVGGDVRGLLFGAGKFLRSSRFDGPRSAPFTPGEWRGTGAPHLPGSFRGHYFAVHYDNFYQSAPESEVATYMEDIALWGVNTIIVGTPGPGTFAPGHSTVLPGAPQIAVLVNRTRSLLQLAVEIGLSPALIMVPNQGFDNGTHTHPATPSGHSPFPYTPFPDPLRVRGNLGALTCAFKGHDYLLDIRRKELEVYSDIGIDWIVFWPYDEGGCGCEDDWPWGGKGFPRISSKMATMGRTICVYAITSDTAIR
jgi:hypothetical protein